MILLETAKKKEKIIMIAYIHEKKERCKKSDEVNWGAKNLVERKVFCTFASKE
jgi:hypothetical protein